MKKTSVSLFIVAITAILAGCKLAVIVVEGGEVQSASEGVCIASAICIVDVDDPNFYETFKAVPHEGWYFEKWNSGYRFFCGGSTNPTCTLSFDGHEESDDVADLVASEQTFYLMPLFRPERNIIRVAGREWLQPTIFTGLTWDEINAVCPAGTCDDSGELNGYNMSGWTWASVDEVKALFNDYIGYDALNSETDFYKDLNGEAVRDFFKDGWQPTYKGTIRDFVGTEWRVLLRDIEPYFASTYAGEGYVLLLHGLEASNGAGGPEAKEGDFVSASFKARVDWDFDYDGVSIGGLFFR